MNEINILNGLNSTGLSGSTLGAVMKALAIAQAGSVAQNAIVNHVVPALDTPIQNAVNNGEYKNDPIELFYNVLMTSQGQLDIVDQAVAETEGITNIPFGKVPSDMNGVFMRIEVDIKTTAGVALKTAAYAPLATTDDAAIMNGSLELKIAGKRLLKIPMSSFHHSPNVADQCTLLQNGYNLKTPYPFLGGSQIEFQDS